jgi:phage gp46-like protein
MCILQKWDDLKQRKYAHHALSPIINSQRANIIVMHVCMTTTIIVILVLLQIGHSSIGHCGIVDISWDLDFH